MGAQECSEMFMSFHGAMLLRGWPWLLMSAHEHSQALIIPPGHAWAAMSTHEYGTMSTHEHLWKLMSAHEHSKGCHYSVLYTDDKHSWCHGTINITIHEGSRALLRTTEFFRKCLKNVHDEISRPLETREIQKTKAECVLLDTQYDIQYDTWYGIWHDLWYHTW